MRGFMLFVAGLVACDLDRDTPTTEPMEEGEDAVAAAPDRVEADNPPLQQAENAADIDITAEVRRQVLDHPELGADADNLTITSRGGVVTVRGQVDSAAEKDTVIRIAGGVSGVSRVQDEIVFQVQAK